MSRKAGFYWVLAVQCNDTHTPRWEPAEWIVETYAGSQRSYWYQFGWDAPLDDDNFIEIGDPVAVPTQYTDPSAQETASLPIDE